VLEAVLSTSDTVVTVLGAGCVGSISSSFAWSVAVEVGGGRCVLAKGGLVLLNFSSTDDSLSVTTSREDSTYANVIIIYTHEMMILL
jgi:hypothetical protein